LKIKIIIIVFLILVYPTFGFAENNSNNQEIDLSTNPGEILFDLSNMKPGDSVSRNLIVTNNGTKDFKFVLTNEFISGDIVFYNQLDLIIESNNQILFEGKLNKFKELEPRLLNSNENENLLLYIKIPMEIGNEFQGLKSDFQFNIYVEGTLGGVLPVDNKLPTTGSEMFNFLATGAAILLAGLILFAYVKRKKLDTKRP